MNPPSPPLLTGDDFPRLTIEEIARIFAIPEHLIADTSKIPTAGQVHAIALAENRRRTTERKDRTMAKQPTLPGMSRTPGKTKWQICGFHPNGPHRWEGEDRPCPWCKIEELEKALESEFGTHGLGNPATTPAREAGLAEGTRLADEGAKKAAQKADDIYPGWTDDALDLIREIAFRSEFVHRDDVLELGDLRNFPAAPDNRAWGTVWKAARKNEWIRDTGTTRPTTRPTAHRKPCPVYESLIWQGRPR